MSDFIIIYFDQIIAVLGIIAIAFYSYPHFKAKLSNGFQASDIPEAIAEGAADYKNAIEQVETHIIDSVEVINDVTINDADTVANVKSALKTAQSVITSLKQFK